MTFFRPVQVFMAPMKTVSSLFCGSYYRCEPGGPCYCV